MNRLTLRPYQTESVEGLRAGIRAGHRAQMLYASTGAGKTVISAHMMDEARSKGSKVAFVVDRVSLVDQTSAVLDSYGIDHGVVQAGHWRFRPYEPIQVCSAQTIERRGFFPDMRLLVVDEAHCMRRATIELIKSRAGLLTIGLSATPFTNGLGSVYSNIVNVTTTNKLIEEGWLVPLTIYAARTIDMKGAKVVAGEWSDKEIEERGLKIVGDIVAEWVDKTNRHFGGPVKTIVFSATVDHGEELCRQFNAAGFNFQQISYKDADDDRRRELIAEFRKPDSAIDGLVSCEALARGFDVPDVLCGIGARPYRKSLSSHIQQLGRVMRPSQGKTFGLWLDHCIASGQRVLTDRGLVPIEKITLEHRLWDGIEFVRHGGVVSRGIKPVIQYAGLTATADHPVATAQGWRTLGWCSDKQEPVITTGVGRTALRERDHHLTGPTVAGRARSAAHSCALRMRRMRLSIRDFAIELAKRANEGLQSLQPAEACTGLAALQSHADEAALLQPTRSELAELRRTRDRVPFRLRDYWRTVDCGEPGASRGPGSGATGPDQQRRPLRTGKHSVGKHRTEPSKQTPGSMGSDDARLQVEVSARSICGHIASRFASCWPFFRGNRKTLARPISQTKREVWDVLNCGPRNRFTCEGLLVHNSGNVLRFHADTEEVFAAGVSELTEEGLDSKVRKEPTEQEKEAIKCAKCAFILPPAARVCPACGHERVRRSLVESVAGTMVEVGHNGKALPSFLQDRDAVWRQLSGYALERKGGDEDAARRFAQAQYKNLYGAFAHKRFDPSEIETPSAELVKRVRANLIRWAKGRQRMAA